MLGWLLRPPTGSSGFIRPQPGLQLFYQGRFVLLPGQDQGLLEVLDRLVDPSALRQSDAEVVVGLGVVGLDFQGLLVMRDRLVDPSAAAKAMPRLSWASA